MPIWVGRKESIFFLLYYPNVQGVAREGAETNRQLF